VFSSVVFYANGPLLSSRRKRVRGKTAKGRSLPTFAL